MDSAAKVACWTCLGTGRVFFTRIKEAARLRPVSLSRSMRLTEDCPTCNGNGYV